MVNAKKLWEKGYTGKDVVVAVIDTGCQKDHPSLEGRILGGRNFTTDDNSDPNVYEDYQGHGTHVAGTISSNKSTLGTTGVAPDSKLLICKALDRNGNGDINWIVNAINYAVEQKVDIISMSLGCPQDSMELRDAVGRALKEDILIVCASGNRGDSNYDTDELDYPGAYDRVIVVGAVDSNTNIANFSNSNKFIDVVAPGVDVLSTYKEGKYAKLSGTSMATPHVSGALALLVQFGRAEFGRDLTQAEYFAQLIKCTESLGVSRKLQGNGLVKLEIN